MLRKRRTHQPLHEKSINKRNMLARRLKAEIRHAGTELTTSDMLQPAKHLISTLPSSVSRTLRLRTWSSRAEQHADSSLCGRHGTQTAVPVLSQLPFPPLRLVTGHQRGSDKNQSSNEGIRTYGNVCCLCTLAVTKTGGALAPVTLRLSIARS